jgi:lipoyl(octanoyl) transferase
VTQAPDDVLAHSTLTGIRVRRVELGTRLIPYREAWELQRQVHREVVAGERPDTLLLLEHEAVFTAGSRTLPQDRPVDDSTVIDVDRGGRITWHGPGQLVGYPIVRLPQRLDVVAYVRSLEQLLIAACAVFDVDGQRVEGRSGVWIPTRPQAAKVAAIGVRVAGGVTMHGFALNCDCDLSWSRQIVPCGIPDAGVTSLTVASGSRVRVSEAATVVADLLRART